MKNKIKFAYFFVVAYLRNLYIEFYNSRIENKKRHWKAYGTFGGGVVPLGKLSMNDARIAASKLGKVIYSDPEQAAIFYSENR